MSVVTDDGLRSAKTARCIDVLQREEARVGGSPHLGALCQDALHGGLVAVVLQDNSQEVQTLLLCCVDDSLGLSRPGQVGRDAQEGEELPFCFKSMMISFPFTVFRARLFQFRTSYPPEISATNLVLYRRIHNHQEIK